MCAKEFTDANIGDDMIRKKFAVRLSQISCAIWMSCILAACDLDPTDYDNFRAHGSIDFIAYGQPYHRDWNFLLHRNGTFSIDIGPIDDWSVSQGGVLAPGPNGSGFLISATGYFPMPWDKLARDKTVEMKVPVLIVDHALDPRSFQIPPDPCDNSFPVDGCFATIRMQLDMDQRAFSGRVNHQSARGWNPIKSELTGKMIDLSDDSIVFVSASYMICPAQLWQKAVKQSDFLALLAQAAQLGDAVGLDSFSGPLYDACLPTQDPLLPLEQRSQTYALAYVDARAWRIPMIPDRRRMAYRMAIPLKTDRSSASSWRYISTISSPSGSSFKLRDSHIAYAFLVDRI